MKRKIAKMLIIILIAVSLTGCVSGKLTVVTTNYPVEFLVQSLAGDRVDILRLDDESSIVQRSQIKSNYAEILDQANVVFIISELQPYYELYRDEINETEVVDLAALSTLYNFKRYTIVDVSGQKHAVESSYYDTALLNNTDMYTQLDPMLWMDPAAMTSMASTIRDWLIRNYPEEQAFFNKNYETLELELTRLQVQFQAIRDSGADIRFVSMTPSYGNWQKSYHIGVYPVVLSKYGVLPDEDLLSVMRQQIISDGVQYIAYEDDMPEDYEALYNRLQMELELTSIKLDNLYSLSDEDRANDFDYISKMYENLQTLESLTDQQP